MKPALKIKPLDLAAFLLAAAVLAGISISTFGGAAEALTVEITGDGQQLLYDVSENRTVDVVGPLGTTRISIGNGEVAVLSSPCADQLCIHMGTIRKAGRWIACLPNQVFIRIRGEERDDIDAHSY